MPVQHGTRMPYFTLSKGDEKILNAALKHMKLVVVDEVSMLSNMVFMYLDKRLQEIRRNKRPFGGVSWVVVGDLAQLAPVQADYIFETMPAEIVAAKGFGVGSCNLWQTELNHYDELRENMRQKDDPDYADILDSLRFGQLTEKQVDTLRTRLIALDAGSMLQSLVDKFFELQKKDARIMVLLPRVAMVDQLNQAILKRSGSPIVELAAKQKIHGCTSTKELFRCGEQIKIRAANITTTAGVELMLTLAVGARVMLR